MIAHRLQEWPRIRRARVVWEIEHRKHERFHRLLRARRAGLDLSPAASFAMIRQVYDEHPELSLPPEEYINWCRDVPPRWRRALGLDSEPPGEQ